MHVPLFSGPQLQKTDPQYYVKMGRSRQDARKELISDVKFKDVQGISEIVDELAEVSLVHKHSVESSLQAKHAGTNSMSQSRAMQSVETSSVTRQVFAA
jgi:hypothetical protein